MDAKKRQALEKAGWKLGDAADFLEMSDEERQLLDIRLGLAQAIRKSREARHWSQKQLGAKLQTSQPRVARIEQAAADVSLDQLVRAYAAVGGKVVVKYEEAVAKPMRSPSLKVPESVPRKRKEHPKTVRAAGRAPLDKGISRK